MNDVRELASLLRQYASHRTFAAPKKTWEEAAVEAADALETLAPEMWCMACGTITRDGACDCTKMGMPGTQDLKPYAEEMARQARDAVLVALDLRAELAKLTPVVEAARQLDMDDDLQNVAGWYDSLANLRQALATLEADHD